MLGLGVKKQSPINTIDRNNLIDPKHCFECKKCELKLSEKPHVIDDSDNDYGDGNDKNLKKDD